MTAAYATLLVEIRTEELPPAQLWRLADAFPDALLGALQKAGFADEKKSQRAQDQQGRSKKLATPRRLVALLHNIKGESDAETIIRRGPQIAACRDSEGAPTKALLGFMRSAGAACENDLHTIEEESGKTYIAWKGEEPPRRLAKELAAIVESVLLNLPAPRLMRWGANEFKFIRPARGVLMLHGSKVIDGEVLGVRAGDSTKGHPTLCAENIAPQNADEYESVLLKRGRVIVDMDARLERIQSRLAENAHKNPHIVFPRDETEVRDNSEPRFSPISAESPLLREVAAMCESPFVHHRKMDDAFMQLPAFCITECLKTHLRFFPCRNTDGNLSPDYFLVADNAPENPDAMLRGYDAVLRARLRDLWFYYEEDKTIPLSDYVEKLNAIVFHKKLGSQRDRIGRVCRIAAKVAELNGDEFFAEEIKDAAEKILAPLSTLMVGEYPGLQEYMARQYFGDSPSFVFVARCYDLEKLVGMFGAGEIPTGSKDPHGLRRDALNIAYSLILVGGIFSRVPDVRAVINAAVESFDGKIADVREEVYEFILDRIRFVLSPNAPGRPVLERPFHPVLMRAAIEPVLSQKPSDFRSLGAKLRAIYEFVNERPDESATLIAANRRINNILRKSDAGGGASAAEADAELFCEDAERALHKTIGDLRTRTNAAVAKDDFGGALRILCEAAAPIDAFFNEVLVNAEDAKVRANRFALLRELRALLNCVADISKLA